MFNLVASILTKKFNHNLDFKFHENVSFFVDIQYLHFLSGDICTCTVLVPLSLAANPEKTVACVGWSSLSRARSVLACSWNPDVPYSVSTIQYSP